MLEKKESQKMQIVHFLDIDTNKITLKNQSQANTTEVKLAYYIMERVGM